MKYLYSVKGCSHCDINSKCNEKNSEATIMAAIRRFENHENGTRVWETLCKDFVRHDSQEVQEVQKE